MLLRAGGSGSGGGGGGGNVTGAASSTDNSLARFDGTTGKIIQDYTSTPIIGGDTGSLTINKVPGASDPAFITVGTPFTGGTATTNFPAWYCNVTGAAAVTSFNAAGTWLGCNMPSGFAGNFLHLSVNGASPTVSLTAGGALTLSSTINCGGSVTSSGSFVAASGSLTLGATNSILFTGNARVKCTASNTIAIRNAADSADADLLALNLKANTAGGTLYVKQGTGGMSGRATLVAGTVAVSITGLTTNDDVYLNLLTPGGTMGTRVTGVCTANTLTITAVGLTGSLVATDTSTYSYFIVRPA